MNMMVEVDILLIKQIELKSYASRGRMDRTHDAGNPGSNPADELKRVLLWQSVREC